MDEELLNELRLELPMMLRRWSPRSDRADYECAFCIERAHANEEIRHRTDCLGIKLQLVLGAS